MKTRRKRALAGVAAALCALALILGYKLFGGAVMGFDAIARREDEYLAFLSYPEGGPLFEGGQAIYVPVNGRLAV